MRSRHGKEDVAIQDIKRGIFKENPLLRLCLGICPALAVTTACDNALGMGTATTIVLLLSCLTVSLLRHFIPRVVRTPAFVLIITVYSSMIEMLMSAYMPQLHQVLGIFVPLIAINCIILAQVESHAYKKPVGPVALHAFGMGAGYTLALLLVAFFRELLGHGTLFGVSVLPAGYEPMQLLILPPGAFIALGLITGATRAIQLARRKHKKRLHHHLRNRYTS